MYLDMLRLGGEELQERAQHWSELRQQELSTHPLERVRLKYEGVSIFLAQPEEEVAYIHTHPVSLTIAATGTRGTTHAGTSSPR